MILLGEHDVDWYGGVVLHGPVDQSRPLGCCWSGSRCSCWLRYDDLKWHRQCGWSWSGRVLGSAANLPDAESDSKGEDGGCNLGCR